MDAKKYIIVNVADLKLDGLIENHLKQVHGGELIMNSKESGSSTIVLKPSILKYQATESHIDNYLTFTSGQQKRRVRRNNLRK